MTQGNILRLWCRWKGHRWWPWARVGNLDIRECSRCHGTNRKPVIMLERPDPPLPTKVRAATIYDAGVDR